MDGFLGGADLFSGGSLFGGGIGGDSGAAPSSSDALFSTNVGFDTSGWNVSFGNNSAIDAPYEKTAEQGADLRGGAAGRSALEQYLPYAVLLVGALIAYKAFKK